MYERERSGERTFQKTLEWEWRPWSEERLSQKIGLSAERQIGRAHTPLTCSATRAAAAKNLRFSCHCLAVLWSPSVCLLFTIQYSLLSVLHGVNENVFNFY